MLTEGRTPPRGVVSPPSKAQGISQTWEELGPSSVRSPPHSSLSVPSALHFRLHLTAGASKSGPTCGNSKVLEKKGELASMSLCPIPVRLGPQPACGPRLTPPHSTVGHKPLQAHVATTRSVLVSPTCLDGPFMSQAYPQGSFLPHTGFCVNRGYTNAECCLRQMDRNPWRARGAQRPWGNKGDQKLVESCQPRDVLS